MERQQHHHLQINMLLALVTFIILANNGGAFIPKAHLNGLKSSEDE